MGSWIGALAVARERERIACDLHDAVGRVFYSLSLRTQHCLTLDLDDPDRRAELVAELQSIRRLCADGLGDVRAVAYSLALLQLRAGGLVHALRWLVREFSRVTGAHGRLRVTGAEHPRLPDEVERALYRVAHEALLNVDRHARASGVVVSLAIGDRTAELVVRDDGVGLDQRQAMDWHSAAHLGVRTMARSIHQLGGTFRADPVEPRGLAIRARLPLPQPIAETGR